MKDLPSEFKALLADMLEDYEKKTGVDMNYYVATLVRLADARMPGERGTTEQIEATRCGLYHWNDCLTEVHKVLAPISDKEYYGK